MLHRPVSGLLVGELVYVSQIHLAAASGCTDVTKILFHRAAVLHSQTKV